MNPEIESLRFELERYINLYKAALSIAVIQAKDFQKALDIIKQRERSLENKLKSIQNILE